MALLKSDDLVSRSFNQRARLSLLTTCQKPRYAPLAVARVLYSFDCCWVVCGVFCRVFFFACRGFRFFWSFAARIASESQAHRANTARAAAEPSSRPIQTLSALATTNTIRATCAFCFCCPFPFEPCLWLWLSFWLSLSLWRGLKRGCRRC